MVVVECVRNGLDKVRGKGHEAETPGASMASKKDGAHGAAAPRHQHVRLRLGGARRSVHTIQAQARA